MSDWRIENEEVDRIAMNEWDDQKDGYVRDEHAVNVVRGWFETSNIKPKILSFNEALDEGIVNQRRPYQDEWMHILDCYGKAWLDRGWQPTPASPDWANETDWISPRTKDPKVAEREWEIQKLLKKKNVSHGTWNSWMGERDNNDFFHACKIQWLCNIIRTEGLYSVPQATYRKEHWFVHPGQFRVIAIDQTKCNEEFVVWDYNGRLRGRQIDWEEYWNLYKHHDDKALFCVNFKNHLEMHVGEDRQDLYQVVMGSSLAFHGKKPVLQGTCDEELSHLFDHGTYDGDGIGIVGHIGQEDLRHMLDFYHSTPFIEKESFTLYNNYHK